MANSLGADLIQAVLDFIATAITMSETLAAASAI